MTLDVEWEWKDNNKNHWNENIKRCDLLDRIRNEYIFDEV